MDGTSTEIEVDESYEPPAFTRLGTVVELTGTVSSSVDPK